MLDRLRERLGAVRWRARVGVGRFRRFERRELRQFRRELERTRLLVHLSILLFVPLLVGLLVGLSNRIEGLSFFLFPPLAAGTYTLFANPESKQASPVRFVGGLTAGAVCAWIAVEFALLVVYPDLPPSELVVDAPGAAFAVFLTGALTWGLDVEEPAAYAMALLGLLVEPGNQVAFVASVVVGSSLVAGVFYAWRELFYEQRATYLYESTKGDDHVLVPLRGEHAAATAMLGARLAAAHDAGKVVLLDVVDAPEVARAERARLDELDGPDPSDVADEIAVDSGSRAVETAAGTSIDRTVRNLEAQGSRIESSVGVPCEVLVAAAGSSPARTVLNAAAEANCDLICVPYEAEDGAVTPFVRELFRGRIDVLLHRSYDGRTAWREVMVPVRSPSDVAHSMIDFALRLVGDAGRVSVCHCIRSADRRRSADTMLADLVETFEGNIETRVALAPIEEFLARNANAYDLVTIGASRDRSAASRLIAPPTFERIQDLETDVAVVDRS